MGHKITIISERLNLKIFPSDHHSPDFLFRPSEQKTDGRRKRSWTSGGESFDDVPASGGDEQRISALQRSSSTSLSHGTTATPDGSSTCSFTWTTTMGRGKCRVDDEETQTCSCFRCLLPVEQWSVRSVRSGWRRRDTNAASKCGTILW